MTDTRIPRMFGPQAIVESAIGELVHVSNGIGLLIKLLTEHPENLDVDVQAYRLHAETALTCCHDATSALRALLSAKPE
jgi:hypothetical protein